MIATRAGGDRSWLIAAICYFRPIRGGDPRGEVDIAALWVPSGSD
jgi:hypothetical protein